MCTQFVVEVIAKLTVYKAVEELLKSFLRLFEIKNLLILESYSKIAIFFQLYSRINNH